MAFILSVLGMAIWAYLLLARGEFWRRGTLSDPISPAAWPEVVAIIPARNEAACLNESLDSLANQRYRGAFSIIVVDDDSADGTANIAIASANRAATPLKVVSCAGPPPGWTGKLWALSQGLSAAPASAKYILFTDADIVHTSDSVGALVARAEEGDLALTSLMARLHCESLAERLHVPAFVYFFQMLFPFAWVRRRDSYVAAAAGGCMLVSREALESVGGIETIRDALIDDCALASRLKSYGPIWLDITDRAVSVRAYDKFSELRQMIVRSAYAQLRYSPWFLLGTAVGMAITFVAPPLLLTLASGNARWLGGTAWLAMTVSFLPTLRFYRLSPLWAPALPLIAGLYLLYTFESAYRHLRGDGGLWKGRIHVPIARQP